MPVAADNLARVNGVEVAMSSSFDPTEQPGVGEYSDKKDSLSCVDGDYYPLSKDSAASETSFTCHTKKNSGPNWISVKLNTGDKPRFSMISITNREHGDTHSIPERMKGSELWITKKKDDLFTDVVKDASTRENLEESKAIFCGKVDDGGFYNCPAAMEDEISTVTLWNPSEVEPLHVVEIGVWDNPNICPFGEASQSSERSDGNGTSGDSRGASQAQSTAPISSNLKRVKQASITKKIAGETPWWQLDLYFPSLPIKEVLLIGVDSTNTNMSDKDLFEGYQVIVGDDYNSGNNNKCETNGVSLYSTKSGAHVECDLKGQYVTVNRPRNTTDVRLALAGVAVFLDCAHDDLPYDPLPDIPTTMNLAANDQFELEIGVISELEEKFGAGFCGETEVKMEGKDPNFCEVK